MNKPLHILVIDDNELTRALLRVILRGAEYNVVGEASDARTGLSMAKNLQPDIILLDNNMPNGTGLDILPELKGILPKTVILMVTTNNDEQTIETAMARGASGFVIKPFNTESVLGTMKKVRDKFILASAAGLKSGPTKRK